MERLRRRRLLRMGTTGLAGAVATAGCLGDSDAGDGSANDTTTETTTTASSATTAQATTTTTTTTSSTTTTATTRTTTTTPTFASDSTAPLFVTWSPDPEVMPSETDDGRYLSLATVRDYRDVLPESRITRQADAEWLETELGVSPAAVDDGFSLENAFVVYTGTFDSAAIAATVTERGSADAGSHRGFGLFAGERFVAGISDSTLLLVPASSGDTTALAETLIDTNEGDAPRYVDVDEDYAAMVEPFDDVDFLYIGVGDEWRRGQAAERPFAGLAGVGLGWSIGPSTAEATFRFVYVSPDNTDPEGVRQFVNTAEQFEPYSEPSVEADGRTVTVSTSVPTEELKPVTPG